MSRRYNQQNVPRIIPLVASEPRLPKPEWLKVRAPGSPSYLRLKSLMRRPVIVDGRNIFDPKTMRDRGFVYRGVGRS